MFIIINNKELKTYGSRMTTKNSSIIHKTIGSRTNKKKQKAFIQFYFLDDAFSELDEERRRYLIHSLKICKL